VHNWEEIFGAQLAGTVAATAVAEEDLAKILEAAYVSDSDLLLFPYRIVAVTDQNLIREIAIAVGSDALLSSSLLLVVAIEKNKALENLSKTLERIKTETNLGKQFGRYDAVLTDESTAFAWLVGLAARCAARMSLAARALGHTANTVESFAWNELRRVIAAGDEVDLPFIVGVGGTASQRIGQELSQSVESRCFLDKWGRTLTPARIRGEAQYHDSLVSYFDILGFRSAIEGCSPQEIQSVLIRMGSLSYNDKRLRVITRRGVSTFSDHVVRTVMLEGLSEMQQAEAVEVELSQIRLVQANLAGRGWLVRGGITQGPVFIDDEFVFGPALVEAYELEHDMAKWPRIILHEKLRAKLVGDEHLALQADDGILMLNYLAAGDDVVERVRFLELHAQIIKESLAKENRKDVAEKLHWLMMFHNRIASDIAEEDLKETGIARTSVIVAA